MQDQERQKERRREQEYTRQREQLRKKRRRQSRIRRLKKRLFRLAVVALAVVLFFFVWSAVSRLSPFQRHPFQRQIDVDEIEMPEWITQDFIEPNPYSRPQTALDKVNGIVVHYVGNAGTTAMQNQSYYNSLARTGENYASSHFIIGLEGEIIQCIPLDEIAYCSNERNRDTISIECCHPDDTGEFTEETYESLVKLTRWLCDVFRLDSETDVIRHYDVTGKECPRYYVKNPEAWEQFLSDIR